MYADVPKAPVSEDGSQPDTVHVGQVVCSTHTVRDSVGAGDTFIAATICALARGDGPAEALASGCAVAGRKVGQVGMEGLAEAMPARR